MKIEEGKNYISFSTDDMNESELEITDVYVCPQDRGQGIGRKLIKQAIQYARDNNYESIGLFAEPQSDNGLDGDALIEFYRSCGFESDGDCDGLMQIIF